MRLAVFASLSILAASSGMTAAAWAQPATVTVTQAWSRATAGAARTAAIYVTVTAGEPDRLTGASTPVAETAELHRSEMRNGVMEMRALPNGLDVTPATPIHMAPGGYHIMLLGLKQPLKQGDHVPVTLSFAHAAPITTQAIVAAAGASQPPP